MAVISSEIQLVMLGLQTSQSSIVSFTSSACFSTLDSPGTLVIQLNDVDGSTYGAT